MKEKKNSTSELLMLAAIATGTAIVFPIPLLKIVGAAGIGLSISHVMGSIMPKKVGVPKIVKGSWVVPIGQTKGGRWIYYDFAGSVPHVLIAGTTGGGKSAFQQLILYVLCNQQPPELCEIHIIDLKGGATFSAWRNVPHVKGIYGKINEAEKALRDAEKVMWERLEVINDCRANFRSPPDFPRLFLLIDEGSLLASSDEALGSFARIAAIGREPRVQIVYGTQRPENTVLPLIIREQLGGRFCFKVKEKGTSGMVLGEDHTEAFELPYKEGLMIHQTIRGDMMQVQAAYVDDKLITHWLQSHAAYKVDASGGVVVTLSKSEDGEIWGV